jgi:SAM-dependent methyltransferase
VETNAERWNHNIHYHPMVLDVIPDRAQRALDVGCGEGTLARRLRAVVPHVTAIDSDQASVDLARLQGRVADIDYLLGDFLDFPFEPGSFDVIASVATLHHMDARLALGRMRDLLRPGGVLAIIGLARPGSPADVPVVLAGVVATRFHHLTKEYWEHPSPTVWPPPETYAGMRLLAEGVLPGVRFRRRLLWRYTLTWTKPYC